MGLETSLLLLISSLLFAISPRANLLKILQFLDLSSMWGQRLEVISQLLVVYGIIFLILAAIGYRLHRRGQTILARLIAEIRQVPFEKQAGAVKTPVGPGQFSGWIALALGVGTGIRAYFLSQPMRGDEAFTFLNFVRGSIISLFDYPAPNNHVLNTILIKISTLAWGGSPAAIRMPAFLAGVAAILLTYQLARELNPRKYAGILAAAAVAVFPYLILYSTNARGYSLVVLLTLALALAGLRYEKRPSGKGVAWLAVLSALGMWAMPTMIFGIAGVFCWLSALLWLEKRPLRQIVFEYALPFGVLSALFSFILYTPVIVVSNGITAITANKFVESQSWPEFITLFIPKIQVTVIEILRDIPTPAAIVGLILAGVGLYLSAKSRDWRAFLLLPGLAVGALILLVAQHTTPYARLWVYALPFILIIADYGFTTLAGHFIPRWQPHLQAALIFLGILLAVRLAAGNVITRYPDTSAFPEAPLAAQYLKSVFSKGDIVRVTNTADWSVYYYFWYYGIPYSPEEKQADPGKTFIIVKKSRYSLDDMTDKPVIKLLDFEDLALYQEVKP